VPDADFDQDEVNPMLTKNAATLLQWCAEFLGSYISATRLTGEVRNDPDIPTATE
jgi:hypothetical protein